MLSFYNFNDKTNINRNKNHNEIFSKQGKTFTKLQRMTEEKELNNFKEGFYNLENTPSLEYINYYKNQSEKETQNTNALLQQANNMNYTKSQNIFNNNLQNYEYETSLLIGNTNNYLNGENTLNSNVYVNTFTNDNPSSQFINLYQDNSANPLMTILDGEYTYNTCSNTASLLGMNYFGLEQTNQSNGTGVCSVGNDVNINSFPVYQESCSLGSDGYTYGGGWANAIYQFENGEPTYIGCYKDTSTRAMIPTGDLSYNYNPVYFAGNYNNPPWNLSNYIDPTAQWVWYTQDASLNAPGNPTPVLILGVYNNSSGSYQYADIYGCCDNSCNLVINNTNLDMSGNVMTISGGWTGNGNTGMSVSFNPGMNYIEVYVINQSGPAGLLLSFVNQSNNTILCNTNINGNQSNGAWYYSLITSNYSPPGEQSYSVQTCADYAQLFNYNYFGLQNIQDNTPGTAQCFVSNDLNTAEMYGSLGGSVEYNGNLYGLAYTNAIYKLDISGNLNNMGSVGYVNELNQLSQYPSSMISYKNSDTYTVLPNYDSPGNTIKTYKNVTLQQCIKFSNSNNSSFGFSYDLSHNTCYLKNSSMYSPYSINPNNNSSSSPPPLQYNPQFVLYMKQPTIINENSSCPTEIDTISSTEWSNYTNTGVKMNSNTLCKLQKANNNILQTRQNYQNSLNVSSNILTDNITQMIDLNNELNEQMNIDQDVLTKNVSLYQDAQEKYDDITKNVNKNVNSILNNSSVVVQQSRYYYILWVILAILIIIGFIYLLRN